MSSLKKGCLFLIVALVGLIFVGPILLGSILGDKYDQFSLDYTTTNDAPTAATDDISASKDSKKPDDEDILTAIQKNAARSAAKHLSFSDFSRKGLIRQLSSHAGEGYSVADAIAAVDSLHVDWNEQAVRSAKSYLDMSGFSCKGLIQQLSSHAGDQYTKSEAEHGVKQAGAC